MNRCTALMRGLRDFTCRSGSRPGAGLVPGLGLLICGCLAGGLDAADEADCTPLQALRFEANPMISADAVQALSAPFLERCISPQLLRELLAVYSSHFIDRGYVTTRPYLLEQDISDGVVDVRLLLGSVEAVIDAHSGDSNWRIASAFAFNDDILNLRELETSLEIIERPQSVQASFEIRPGNQPGSSIIAIDTVDGSPLQVELGANARSEVDPQLSVALGLDNPLNLNDILAFRYNSGDLYQAYQSDRSREWEYSAPLGSYLVTYLHRDIDYRRRLQGSNGSFLSEGESVSDRLQIDKLLARARSYRLRLGFALELEDSVNEFEGEVIEVSSYRTSKLEVDLRHDWFARWGQMYSRYAYQQGLDSFGARDDDFFAAQAGVDGEARLQFEKQVLESQVYYYLPNPLWQVNVNLHWQYSDDILYDADKLFLGSENTVRGYNSALAGSNGWYTGGDLVKRLQSVGGAAAGDALIKSISLSLGFDYGEIRCEDDNPDVCGEIYGIGAGLVLADDNFNALLSWGHPLKELDDEVGRDDLFLLDLRWKL